MWLAWWLGNGKLRGGDSWRWKASVLLIVTLGVHIVTPSDNIKQKLGWKDGIIKLTRMVSYGVGV